MDILDISKKEIENLFVQNFFIKEKRERALYELNSSKKRGKFFSGMRGDDPRLKSEYVEQVLKCDPHQEIDILMTLLQKLGAEPVCYLMSRDIKFDQVFMTLRKGIEACINYQMEMAILCSPSLALIRCEQGVAAPPFWILRKPSE